MITAGMNVARINMSHYKKGFSLESLVKIIRKAAAKHGKSVSIMMDLPGPKIRTSNSDIINIKRGIILESFDGLLLMSRNTTDIDMINKSNTC